MFIAAAYAAETPAEGPKPVDGVAHTEAESGHGGGAFPPFVAETYPSQILWLAITFGLFYLFLKRVIMPRLGGIVEGREAKISADLAEAGNLKGEADAAIAAYEQGLAEARQRGNAIANEAREAAKAEADAQRKTVESGLEQRLADAEARIASIKNSAMQDVGTIAEETTAAIVDTLTGSPAEPAEVSAAVRSVRS